ncbi:MAG: LLM class flavin-dependent oxidoreductase [Deltaproteobacteria bacterium]|nr:LLM class flavin-dependent oxidoreductase [Deltaproteobacteria bacterium]
MRRLPIRWGLSLPNRGPLFGLTTIDEILSAAVLAEESGVFESVWFGESLIHKPRLEALVMLGAVAARTRRVRLGTACMASFPVRHPALLGIQWATLDQLSKGRTVLCVCIGGGDQRELAAFGAKREERVPRLVEGIKLLRQMWSDREIDFKGRFYDLERYAILPKPVQKPCPIWIAVTPKKGVERAMRRVVTYGDGYMVASSGCEPEVFKEYWGLIENFAREVGKDLGNFETALHGMVNINEDKRAAHDESRFYFDHYYSPGWPAESTLQSWLAHGPPAECARLIQTWIDMGITTPVLRFTSHNQVGQVRRFIDEVLPLVRL